MSPDATGLLVGTLATTPITLNDWPSAVIERPRAGALPKNRSRGRR